MSEDYLRPSVLWTAIGITFLVCSTLGVIYRPIDPPAPAVPLTDEQVRTAALHNCIAYYGSRFGVMSTERMAQINTQCFDLVNLNRAPQQ